MKKYSIAMAFLCGTAFVCLVLLSLRLSSSAPVSVLLTMFVAPGGILADFLLKPKYFSPPLLVLAANILIYSIAAYGGLSLLKHRLAAEKMQIATIRLVLPVAILLGLVCIPQFNPLWPRGMAQLKMQEEHLRGALPIGLTSEVARATLRSNGIQFSDDNEPIQAVVLDNGDGMRITAGPGERVISARVHTDAGAFPCGYDIQIVLLFGHDDTMRQRYINRVRICP